MTPGEVVAYSPPMINGWQHKGSFVIKFFPTTDPDGGKYCGRIEHVATGQTIRFESQEDLLIFLSNTLRRVRIEFQQADTLAE
jgi:hypothetical protein